MTKHTPGPWRSQQAENGHTAVYPAGSRERVADIYCPPAAGTGQRKEKTDG